MNKILYLVRSPSGGGKSTLASELQCPVVEADMYHYLDGVYRFDSSRINDAHLWCRLETERLLRNNLYVCVANTFTRIREMVPYWQLAKRYGASVHIMEPKTEWRFDVKECFQRNQHNVPLEVIQSQIDRWFPMETGIYNPSDLLERYPV